MKRRCIGSSILWLIFLIGLLPMAVRAETIDTGRACGLTVTLLDGGTPVAGFPFALYCVADVSEQGRFTLTQDFQSYPVEVNDLNGEQYAALAETLDFYVRKDGLIPIEQKKTGTDGDAFFDALSPGLYLVGSSSMRLDGRGHTTAPFLVALPSRSADGVLSYLVSAKPKHDASAPPDTVTCRVQKHWDDAGFSGRRPASVTVELFCDSRLYDTRILTAENNWCYVWENLSARDSMGRLHTWTLREQAVEYYESAIWKEGDTFLVCNTYTGKKLPQTGQLWWPVTAFSGAGLLLLLLGTGLKKRRRDG